VTAASGTDGIPGPRRITIDLDGAWCYRRIHGHTSHDDEADNGKAGDDPLLLQAMPRILELGTRIGAATTLFVVGRDTRGSGVAALLRRAVDAGFELQAHSYAHDYALSRWPRDRAAADVKAALDAIESLGAPRPQGFRAPGYNLSPALLGALVDAGVRWSSSVMGSPAYFALRAAVVARTRLAGRRSDSLLGHPAAFVPRRRRFTHHVDDVTLVEHPIATAAGLPWTGTTLALLPDAVGDALTTVALATTPVDELVFELHAADFADGALLPPDQPDARVPLSEKLRRIERALARVVAHR
jgi:peptidoglycan/xylan/chitin deacetylase (PgdA/CDA1 family)